MDDHHVLLQNQLFYEDVVAFGNVDARIRVECPARRHATDARSRVAPLHGKITTAAQLLADFNQMILRSLERRLNRVLLRMIGTQTRTEQALNTFSYCFTAPASPLTIPHPMRQPGAR